MTRPGPPPRASELPGSLEGRPRKPSLLRRGFTWFLVGIWANAALAVLIFHRVEGLSLVDALYFTVTIITTVGFGDFTLRESAPLVKLYGSILMLTGPTSIAILMGMITDAIVSERLAAFLGQRRRKMKDHVVVCGLGNLGIRVVRQLRRQNVAVFCIERNEDSSFLEDARGLGAEVMVGDARQNSALEAAMLAAASAVVILTDDDLANLEIAVHARTLRPDIRIVLRMFDANLAGKMESAFGIHTVFSSTALSAPAFALAALDSRRSIVNSFDVDDDLVVTATMSLGDASPFVGMALADFERDAQLKVVSHAGGGGSTSLLPGGDIPLASGDRVTVVVREAALEALHVRNEQGAGA